MSEGLEADRASPEKDLTLGAFKVKFEDDDLKNPKNYSSSHKAFLVIQMAMLALAGSLDSSIISPAATSIAEYTYTASEVTPLTVALFVLAFGPMVWAPISEVYGRRMGMFPAVLILGLFSIGTAFSHSATAIFLTRFFVGIFASAPISNVLAALGDIFEPATRGNAMTIVALCITGGPTLGPVIGSALTINPGLGWRWTEYIEGILVFILFLICAFCLFETYAPVLLKEKAQHLRRSTGDQRYWHPNEKEKIEISIVVTKHLARPLKMLFTESMAACLALYASFTYSLIHLVLQVFPIVFKENRKWSLIGSTLPFLSILVGVGCAVFVNFANQPRYKRAVKANCGNAVPEARLPPIIVGATFLSAGLFWFEWTAAPKYRWPLPVIAAGFIRAGSNIAFQQCLNFLVDTYGPYAASAVSANTILRSVLACTMPIAARPMFVNLEIGPAASLLGGISCVALPVPLLFMRYGAALSRKSKFVDGE